MAKSLASPFFAIGGGTGAGQPMHTSQMAKKPKVRWYAREWRKKKGLNLEKAAERLSMAVSYLSDLEKEKRRWNSDHLDALAHAYGIDPEDLLWNPDQPKPLWLIWSKITPDQREQAANILETFIKKAS